MKNLLARALALLGLLLAFVAPAHAGTFSTTAWTDDASSGIVAGQTNWAYHFGSAAAATVNGVPVTGIAAANADFRLMTFYSGTDYSNVRQYEFGSDNGIRVDNTFTATAAIQVITLAVNNSNNATFHI